MPLLVWSDKLSVKIDKIDEQHKHLIAIMNDLYDKVQVGEGVNIDKILTTLSDYVVYHFFTEESLMREHNYPDIASHELAHRALTDRVNDFQNSDDFTIVDLLNFLRDWLNNHILETDMQMGEYVNSLNIRV